MRVAELIKLLQQQDPEAEVYYGSQCLTITDVDEVYVQTIENRVQIASDIAVKRQDLGVLMFAVLLT